MGDPFFDPATMASACLHVPKGSKSAYETNAQWRWGGFSCIYDDAGTGIPPSPPTPLPTAGNNVIYKPDPTTGAKTASPVGTIVVIGDIAIYEPGTSKLKIKAPEIIIQDAQYKKSDFYVGAIVYTPSGVSGETASEYIAVGGKLTDNGVRLKSAGANGGVVDRRLVAGKYTVVVAVVHKDKPGIVLGESAPEIFEVRPRQLTPAMISVDLAESEKVFNNRSKSPLVTVKDGSSFLQRNYANAGVFYDYDVVNSGDIGTNVNVGTYDVVVEGSGNYTGRIVKTYGITKRELVFDQFAKYTFKKEYDGTVAVSNEDSSAFVPIFMGYPSDAPELTSEDYIIKEGSLKYSNKDAGTGKGVAAVIDLANTENANNYKLKSNSFSYSGGVITKGVPTAAMIKATFDNPARVFSSEVENQVLYNKSAKEVKVAWASGVTNSGSKFTVKYNGETAKPVDEGAYAVTVDITEGANLEKVAALELGSLSIVSALSPIIEEGSPADTFYYAKSSVTLRVAARNPKDGKATGLTYQWYKVADTGLVTLKGKTSNNLVVNDTAPGVQSFQVQVTYKGSEQVAASVMSRVVQVTTFPAPMSLVGAIITANNTYEYDGAAKKLTEADLSVTLGGETLDPGSHYVIQSIKNNVNAGEGLVTIKGIGAYKDTETGLFVINKKPLEIGDLQIIYGTDYNGAVQEIRVTAVSGKSGIGEVTRIYTPDSARVNAGSWSVELSIAAGQNFEGIESLPLSQPYVIRKVSVDESMLAYSGVPKEAAWDGKSHAVAAPALKGVGTNYTGALRVVYLRNGEEVTEVADSGLYIVRIEVGGDRNFAGDVFDLGAIEIHGREWVGVREVARDIPASEKSEVAAIVPVKAAVGGLSVGPNPVSGGGALDIFWSGGKAASGMLAVYSSVGNKVAVVPVVGGKRIGTWNTSGVPEGTYLIKGVLNLKDGSKVNVSSLVRVAR
jgi:hypothetical protein